MIGNFLKPTVAAIWLATGIFSPLAAETTEEEIAKLMLQLRDASAEEAQKIDAEIRLRWEHSGSASADFLLKRGKDAMERGEFDVAIGHYTALVDHAPEFAEGWHGRAEAYFNAGLLGPALSDLEHVLALNPQHYEAIAGLGAVFEMIGRPKEAYEAFEQVKAIHPHHPHVTEAMKRLEPLAKGQKL